MIVYIALWDNDNGQQMVGYSSLAAAETGVRKNLLDMLDYDIWARKRYDENHPKLQELNTIKAALERDEWPEDMTEGDVMQLIDCDDYVRIEEVHIA